DFWLGIKHNFADISDWADFGDREEYDGQVDWLVGYDQTQRIYYTWDGDANDIPGNDQFDPRGGPLETGQAEIPTGEFTAPEVNGFAFFYISDGPENTGTAADDPNQPATFRYMEYKSMLSPAEKIGTMQTAWEWMTGEDGDPMYQADHTDDPYQEVPTAQPHYDPVFGVGPYTTLDPDDSIKVVVAFGTGSIPEERAIELGIEAKKYVDSGGSEGIDPAMARQEIFEGGRDSLFARFARAEALYESGYALAEFPPDPPDNVLMTPGPEQVTITWDEVADAESYNLYRAQGGIDNARLYEKIVEETTETSYADEGLTRGTNYYYYVTAFDEDTGLESPHFFSRVNKEVVPFRPPEEQDNWVDEVRVVPNPYNLRGNTYLGNTYPSESGYNFSGGFREQNTLMFVNLPAQCEIKIYNSVGDLVRTLNHTDGSGDERWWPMLTEHNLWPASGVYFYTIEATSGDLSGQVAKGKFVIVR
ncbi:MAG TPA: fibronectin type III domain-containing protein, partial [bacterium]|nr:fibronectin type III domain-containing protein [bacterium]